MNTRNRSLVLLALMLLVISACRPTPANTRANPLPFATPHEVGDTHIRVNALYRDMTDEVLAMNILNPRPDPGDEWLLVNVTMTCDRPPDVTCSTFGYNFDLVGRLGEIYDQPFVSLIYDKFEGEVFGGTSLSGNLGYLVAQADRDFVLLFDNPFDNVAPLYFATGY